ncbi:uncharacterized protein TNCV_1363811 [Trichonephila clavipes]|uniref:Uncharacterized protein n=1 Tax=Trichonephila clavipes TaxID=2585209 RepID=A0A8X6RXY2_TRICX|nr:uncharacterized protein TNCV_1363811 [Trichonephila clavipes]
MVTQRFTQITPPAAPRDQLWQRVEAAWSAVPQEHIQSLFESMPRHVAAVISNNGRYSGYLLWQELHFTDVYKLNHLILGQHVIYKINFVVLSLFFLGVAFTVACSVVPNSFKECAGYQLVEWNYILIAFGRKIQGHLILVVEDTGVVVENIPTTSSNAVQYTAAIQRIRWSFLSVASRGRLEASLLEVASSFDHYCKQ